MAKIAEKVAARYARALFDLIEPSQLDVAAGLLLDMAQVWENMPDLRDLMRNPRASYESRIGMISELVKGATKGSANSALEGQMESFLKVLFENARLEALPQVAKIFQAMVNELRKVLSVEVSSASELGEGDKQKLIEKITQASGGLASVKWIINPELLAGLRIKVGDRLLDSTVDGALERLRTQLVG